LIRPEGIHEYEGKPIYAKKSEPYIQRWNRTYVYEDWMDIDALPSLEEVIAVNAIKSEAMTTDEQEVVHYADAKKGGLSTLCGITIPPAKESMIDKEITCVTCRGATELAGDPNRS
jgi:hypothetical protein